jgi:hypothetical protein
MDGSPTVIAVDHGWGCMARYGRKAEFPTTTVSRKECGFVRWEFSQFPLTRDRVRRKAKQGGVSRWRAGSLTVNLRGAFPR